MSQLFNDHVLMTVSTIFMRKIVEPEYNGDVLIADVWKYNFPTIYLGLEIEVLLDNLKQMGQILQRGENVIQLGAKIFLLALLLQCGLSQKCSFPVSQLAKGNWHNWSVQWCYGGRQIQ